MVALIIHGDQDRVRAGKVQNRGLPVCIALPINRLLSAVNRNVKSVSSFEIRHFGV